MANRLAQFLMVWRKLIAQYWRVKSNATVVNTDLSKTLRGAFSAVFSLDRVATSFCASLTDSTVQHDANRYAQSARPQHSGFGEL